MQLRADPELFSSKAGAHREPPPGLGSDGGGFTRPAPGHTPLPRQREADSRPYRLSHGTLGTCEYMKPTRTYTETQNAQQENPRNTHSEVLPPPPAMRRVNTHLHPPAAGTHGLSSRARGARARPRALLSL